MTSVWRVALLATLMAISGCASLSRAEREQAQAIVVSARSSVLTCPAEQTCAQASPLRELADEPLPSTPNAGGLHPEDSAASVPSRSPVPMAADVLHHAILLEEGELSLVARLNLIRSARSTIELQTYIFDTDDSARLILDELLAAAHRGVQVRLLIDQLSAITDLKILAALSGAHANFQLRVYNPTLGKVKLSYWDYVASVICCFRQFNQRMHNKLLVVDGALGVVGGRNYQDDYYDWDEEYNFRDRDVILVGPVVSEMRDNFDAFWQAPRSVPSETLNDVGRLLLRSGVPVLAPAQWRKPDRVDRVRALSDDRQWIQQRLVDAALRVRGVQYVADLPVKHRATADKVHPHNDQLGRFIASAREDLLLQTPYLVLSDQAQDLLSGLQQRPQPPRIRVSTNSLAATDNPVVYALSYKYKRRNVRDLGMDIFEYKPFPATPPLLDRADDASLSVEGATTDSIVAITPAPATPVRMPLWDFGSRRHGTHMPEEGLRRRIPGGSEVDRQLLRSERRLGYLGTPPVNRPLPVTGRGIRRGLHAKSLVIDRRVGIIGTHNFDPRSENYNTEGTVIIEDPLFARQLAASIERDISPENSWVVAPRPRLPLVGQFSYNMARAMEAMPVLDLWPWRYATVYDFQPSVECPAPLPRRDPAFESCYRAVGDFPGVNVGGKWLLVRMLTGFGSGLVPIL